MPISKHEDKMINLQYQMRQNQAELQDYLADLDNWESDIKQKEEGLKASKSNDNDKNQDLPPVRNTIHKKKLKRKKKEKPVDPNKPKRISGYDFRSWDKFDVDKALEEIDKEEGKQETSSSEYETDEEWEMERKKHLAGSEKDKGNDFLKKGDYERAVEAYTKGMEFDATNAILPANRALALLKQQKFAAAELDGTTSISLDPMYVKAYLRRATARAGMDKLQEAVSDYSRVLDLEPSNKQAKTELERLQKELERGKEKPVLSSLTDGEKGIVKPIYKPPEERSKAPLRRIPIEEIGLEPSSRPQTHSLEQSDVAKKITAKEGEEFDKLFKSPAAASADIRPSSSQAHDPRKSTSTVAESSRPLTDMCEESKTSGKSESSCGKRNELQGLSSVSDSDITTVSNTENPSPASSRGVAKGLSNSSQSISTDASKTISHVQIGSSKTVSSLSNGGSSSGTDDRQGVPQTSYQFQADFKLLKNKPEAFYTYFQAIPPAQYSKLFGQCLDADILNAILRCLAAFSDRGGMDLFDVLYQLTLVKRFSMTAMFLSTKDKQVACGLIEQLEQSGACSESQISLLRKKYEL